MQTGSSGTLIGWKSGQTTFVPLWGRMEGAWLWTLDQIEMCSFDGADSGTNTDVLVPSCRNVCGTFVERLLLHCFDITKHYHHTTPFTILT
jgi:hypothetical protein